MHQQPASIPSPAAGRISNRQVLCAASSSAEAGITGSVSGFAGAEPAPASGTGTSAVPGAAKYTANEIAMRKAADLPVD